LVNLLLTDRLSDLLHLVGCLLRQLSLSGLLDLLLSILLVKVLLNLSLLLLLLVLQLLLLRHLRSLLLLHCLLLLSLSLSLSCLYLLLLRHLLGHILLLLYLVLHNLLLHQLLWLLDYLLLSSHLVGRVERLLRDNLGLSLGLDLGYHLLWLRLQVQERLGLLLRHVERDVLVHRSSGFLVGEGVHVGLLLRQGGVHNF